MAVATIAYGPAIGAVSTSASTASASSLLLGPGRFFPISGTTNIDYISTTGFPAGSEITLMFAGVLTLNHNTGTVPAGYASMILAASANVATTANDIIKLLYDGTNWRQTTALLAV